MRILPIAIVLSLTAACGGSTSDTGTGEQAQAVDSDGAVDTAACTEARDAFHLCLTEAGCDVAPPPRGEAPTAERQACLDTCVAEHDAMHAACPRRHGRGGGDPACRERAEGECAPAFEALRACFDVARATCQQEGPVCDETGACAEGPLCQAALADCADERTALDTCMGDCARPEGEPGGRDGRGPGGRHGRRHSA